MQLLNVGINGTRLESYSLDEGGLDAADGMRGPIHG
jgi:hypothetical protein